MSKNSQAQKPCPPAKPVPAPKEPKVVIENSAGSFSGKSLGEAIAKAVGEKP